MTKKKRKGPTLDQQIQRPWCYYCERDFDDMMILTSHQKAKHFKCERCGRRLNTAGGLSVHLNQVHKEQLEKVENALPNRGDPGIEIFGTEGIPEDAVRDHQQRVIQTFHQNAAAHQARTGNPHPGSKDGPVSKRPKLPPPGELKKQLKEFIAAKNSTNGASNAATNGTNVGNGSAVVPGAAAEMPDLYRNNGYNETAQFQQPPVGQAPPGFQHPSSTSPPPNAAFGQPPGLPQRPQQAAAAAPVSNWQQMHQGHVPPTQDPRGQADKAATTSRVAEGTDPSAQASARAPKAVGAEAGERKGKKGPPVRLKINRKDVSPEESLASKSKYFFDVGADQPVVFGSVTGAVTGTVDDQEMQD